MTSTNPLPGNVKEVSHRVNLHLRIQPFACVKLLRPCHLQPASKVHVKKKHKFSALFKGVNQNDTRQSAGLDRNLAVCLALRKISLQTSTAKKKKKKGYKAVKNVERSFTLNARCYLHATHKSSDLEKPQLRVAHTLTSTVANAMAFLVGMWHSSLTADTTESLQ